MHGSPCTIVRPEVVLHLARADHSLTDEAGMLTGRLSDPHLYWRRRERALLKPRPLRVIADRDQLLPMSAPFDVASHAKERLADLA